MKQHWLCETCGKPLMDKREDAQFCSWDCRQAHRNQRRRQQRQIRKLLKLWSEIEENGGLTELLAALKRRKNTR